MMTFYNCLPEISKVPLYLAMIAATGLLRDFNQVESQMAIKHIFEDFFDHFRNVNSQKLGDHFSENHYKTALQIAGKYAAHRLVMISEQNDGRISAAIKLLKPHISLTEDDRAKMNFALRYGLIVSSKIRKLRVWEDQQLFHHQAIMEYLAACWISNNLSQDDLQVCSLPAMPEILRYFLITYRPHWFQYGYSVSEFQAVDCFIFPSGLPISTMIEHRNKLSESSISFCNWMLNEAPLKMILKQFEIVHFDLVTFALLQPVIMEPAKCTRITLVMINIGTALYNTLAKLDSLQCLAIHNSGLEENSAHRAVSELLRRRIIQNVAECKNILSKMEFCPKSNPTVGINFISQADDFFYLTKDEGKIQFS